MGVILAGRILEVGPPATLGGRAGAATTVRWLEGGTVRTMQTDAPTRTVVELAGRFDDGEIPELAVLRPSLEDIYLRMIGEGEHNDGNSEGNGEGESNGESESESESEGSQT